MVLFQLDKSKKFGVLSGDHFNDIREHFSVKNEGARFARMRGRFIPSRTYAITPGGRMDPCLFYEITKFLLNGNYCTKENIKASEEFIHTLRPNAQYQKSVYFNRNAYNNLSLELRDYQKEVVSSCLDAGRGVVVLATAGGKTLVMASLLSNFYTSNSKFKCLLIVPDLGLVSQTYNDFKNYNVPFFVTKWTGADELNTNANVIIANMGILMSGKSELSWLENINMLVVDEVHKVRRSNKINDVLKKINTCIRFGFTGTLPEDKLDQWNIIGKIGPIIYEKNSFQLRTQKYIANVSANVIEICYEKEPEYKAEIVNPAERYRAELEFLFDNSFRNKTLASIANNAPNNVLILIDFIKHGETLYEHLSKICSRKKIFFIQGDVEVQDREKVRDLMEKNNNIVCVAISKIFSTGVNIKNLHFIVFAGGGKAKVRTVQSIGRGLRLHDKKEKLNIIDIADQLTYGRRHQLKRQSLYEQETIPYQIKRITEKGS